MLITENLIEKKYILIYRRHDYYQEIEKITKCIAERPDYRFKLNYTNLFKSGKNNLYFI
ncbi:hypothetical protein GCM10007422_01640 [Pedobacter zeae]|uniref:Uncharacterized protein n=1 Tax=Pedobacter zeae TaxID=1737356 RepID=A0A7W6P5Y0_9SPHI|nr:hypothetical protein [Pedobacter zeae]GGG92286.1 hypothetical protein GCM10007422_01640 [Pedobacter zeae]